MFTYDVFLVFNVVCVVCVCVCVRASISAFLLATLLVALQSYNPSTAKLQLLSNSQVQQEFQSISEFLSVVSFAKLRRPRHHVKS